jgi:hypothetical protein
LTQGAFAFATEAAPPLAVASGEWVTGQLPDRSGVQAYTVLIRAPGDPERTPRESGPRDMKADWRRTLMKQPVEEIEAAIIEHSRDGAARTLNRLSVEMIDKTADVIHDTPFEWAVWSLVSKRVLEFTMAAPVHFRMKVTT